DILSTLKERAGCRKRLTIGIFESHGAVLRMRGTQDTHRMASCYVCRAQVSRLVWGSAAEYNHGGPKALPVHAGLQRGPRDLCYTVSECPGCMALATSIIRTAVCPGKGPIRVSSCHRPDRPRLVSTSGNWQSKARRSWRKRVPCCSNTPCRMTALRFT